MKTFVENILSSKPVEICLSAINKQLNKWQEVIQDENEYIIEWN